MLTSEQLCDAVSIKTDIQSNEWKLINDENIFQVKLFLQLINYRTLENYIR